MYIDTTIKFVTINVDGLRIARNFNNIDEMRIDWFSEEGTTLPSLDDKLVSASVCGKSFEGSTFKDLADYIQLDNISLDCFGGYGAEECCKSCVHSERCRDFTKLLNN